MSILYNQILTYALAALAIILGLILYFKSKRVRKPLFAAWSFNLIKDASKKLKKLEVLYSQKKIENLTITNIAFWNAGRETIRKEDIAKADPLKIVVNDKYEILDSEVIKMTNDANLVEAIKENNKSFIITFDYLDKGEGAVIRVIHTGQLLKDIDFIGKIIGAGTPKQVPRGVGMTKRSAAFCLFLLLIIIILVIDLWIKMLYWYKIVFILFLVLLIPFYIRIIIKIVPPKELVE